MSSNRYLKLHYEEKCHNFRSKILCRYFFADICPLLSFKSGKFREVAEWSKAHAWKVCIRHKRIEGSNPFLSANAFVHEKICRSLLQ